MRALFLRSFSLLLFHPRFSLAFLFASLSLSLFSFFLFRSNLFPRSLHPSVFPFYFPPSLSASSASSSFSNFQPFHPSFHSVAHVRLSLTHTRTRTHARIASLGVAACTRTRTRRRERGRARTHGRSKIDVTRRGECGKYMDTRTPTPDVR